ncbi:TPA: hypothetical protein ACPJ0Q_004316 [Vibrio diabolicus]|uniref:Uncharacterized protein n=2 Tax=Vibrionaceae TaxID=641 RepID=A0A7Y0MZQ9_VIBAL|nr:MULTISPECIES: hypothetical protein [Vibrio]MDW1969949.1 hypothetical protein [Vibrio sp. 945]EGR3344820.1 hypothetical protein [Vibrio parahaemolyticus]EIA1624636.1 hypothetical protein [Vibrio parahaemolyticus]EIV8635957.1 hypothetical protein [Vibrio parahaemolyticus]EIZ1449461.1 hypothetical protein [Vibrio parahaemolyticus]
MASKERCERLIQLVEKAGSTRKAKLLIDGVKGVSPCHTAIYKAMNGGGTTDYVVQCYIDDLETALSKPKQQTNSTSKGNH